MQVSSGGGGIYQILNDDFLPGIVAALYGSHKVVPVTCLDSLSLEAAFQTVLRLRAFRSGRVYTPTHSERIETQIRNDRSKAGLKGDLSAG